MTTYIPVSHADLIGAPHVATLVTLMPDEYPQATAVWCKMEENVIQVITRDVLQKYRNIIAYPKVALLCIDRNKPQRYIEIRGDAAVSRDGANDLLKVIATSYGRPDYPIEQGAENRVIITITPQRIVTRG